MPLALEYGTWHWHLPTAKVQMSLANGTRHVHHEIRPQKASSSDPPTTGSSGDPRVTDPRSLAHWASREPAIEHQEALHTTAPTAPAMREPPPTSQAPRAGTCRSGRQPVIHCTIPGNTDG